jgi:hypothetical protein
MDSMITKEIADWNKVPTAKGKKLVVVRFPNCSFKWIPTYKQLEQIQEALKEIEQESWNIPIQMKGGIN